MTREDAIRVTARWWIDMMLAQVWDNGDPESEARHAFFRRTMPTPTEADRPALTSAMETYVVTHLRAEVAPRRALDCYCDYAAGWLDTVLHAVNPAWDSRFCGPQKAGTRILIDPATGEMTVLAKRGYGQEWLPLEA
jgi:hypothetical protein